MYKTKKSDSKNNKPYLNILCENQSNKDNFPHCKMIWDNHATNNGISHVKVIWDNRNAKKIDIWINGKITTLN